MAAANTQNPTVTIWIDANDSCKVTPQKVDVKAGDSVTFDNQTRSPVTIWFPEGKPLGLDKLPVDSNPVAKQVKTGTSGTSGTTYPYAVYCSVKRDFCSASAMPIIIVHP